MPRPHLLSPFVSLTNDELLVYTLSHAAAPTSHTDPPRPFYKRQKKHVLEPVRQTRSLP